MTTRIKICGLTNPEDALYAARAGADYLGFILAERSPRRIEPSELPRLLEALPPAIPKIGVFADTPPETILDIMENTPLDIAQIHDDPVPAALFEHLGPRRIWPVLALATADDVQRALHLAASRIVIDTAIRGQTGGTGKTGNWDLAETLARQRPVILAGGLNPENITRAIARVGPYAVDVSSGIEDHPRRKNHARIDLFIRRARATKKTENND